MFGKLRDSWVVWRRKVGEVLHAHSETLDDYGDKLDTYNPVAKTEDMSTPVGVDDEGKLWTNVGESKEPNASFNVVAETPFTLLLEDARLFVQYCLTADFYIDDEEFYLDTIYISEQNIIYEYYSNNDNSVIFSTNRKFTGGSITSSISGTLNMYINKYRDVLLPAYYDNNQITIDIPYSVIVKHIESSSNGALIVHITNNSDVTAIGYLTISVNYNGGTVVHNISCDIDINGKFNFTIDANDQIVGTHGAS